MANRLNPAGPTPETRSPKYHRGLRISEPASYRLPTSLLSHKQPSRVCYNLPAPSARRILEAGSYTLLEILKCQRRRFCNSHRRTMLATSAPSPKFSSPFLHRLSRNLEPFQPSSPRETFSFQHPLRFPKRGGGSLIWGP